MSTTSRATPASLVADGPQDPTVENLRRDIENKLHSGKARGAPAAIHSLQKNFSLSSSTSTPRPGVEGTVT